MARVNHKLVKQRLNEKRSKITDKQFFSSRMLAGHFEDLAAAQTRRYHYNRRVRVNLYWKPKDAFTAATDNMQIRINTGHPLVTKVKGRENRYQLVCGMFAHELGHVLFTDFLSAQTYHNYLDSFKWYPRPPAFRLAADARNEKAFWEYVKEDPKNLQMVHQIAANIANIIEDGYIENRMLNSFPGTLGYGLETLRERHFDEIDTVTELIAKETDDGRHILESILQIMLSYAKFGRIKYGDEPKTDERICFDIVIMAPEMIIVPGQSKKSIKLYILSEDWAAHGNTGHSSSIYSDPLEVRARLNEALGNEIDSGCLSDWIGTPEYQTETSENSYEGWLDGFYCESHYAISLEERNVVLTPSVIGDVGRTYLDASRYEDFASQVEEWEEVGELSEEEYQRYLTDKRIPNMIDKGLSDIYWECYWEAVSEAAHTLLREYLARNTHSGTESAEIESGGETK